MCFLKGCGTVVLVKDQTFVHSPNFPRFYSHDCVVRWVIYAPLDHIVKVMCRFVLGRVKLFVKDCCLTLTDVFQLNFDSFDLEESDTCLYDSLTILGDVEGTEEIGRRQNFFCALLSALGINVDICVDFFFFIVAVMCGSSIPPPVLSYHSLMVLHFMSDSSVARRGFHATVAFISHAGVWPMFVRDSHRLSVATSQQKSLS